MLKPQTILILFFITVGIAYLIGKKLKNNSIIPRKVLFGNPDKRMVLLSPDGRYISFLAQHCGAMNVFVAKKDDLSTAMPITNEQGRGVISYSWTYKPDTIIFNKDQDGDENWQIHSINVTTKETLLLTPKDNVSARIAKVSNKNPDNIAVLINDRDAVWHDLYIINLENGAKELIYENTDEFSKFLLDEDFNLALAGKLNANGSSSIFKKTDQGFELFDTIPFEDLRNTRYLSLSLDGKKAYVCDSRQSNFSVLKEIDLDSKQEKIIAQDPLGKSDFETYWKHPVSKKIEAVSFEHLVTKWFAIGDFAKTHLETMQNVCPEGIVYSFDTSLDEKTGLITFVFDNQPTKYFLYDTQGKKAKYLFSYNKKLETAPLVKMHPIVIKSRDGLELVSYLSLPLDADPKQTGQPKNPVPLVLYVHGGPHARDSWGFQPDHQLFANRGYAVLSVNYRGSAGFGKDFMNAANSEWGRKMHDDLLDAVQFAIDNKIAIKDKIAIFGGSYGGYAALAGLTFSPDTFCCSVDIVGVSDLQTLLETVPPYWQSAIKMFRVSIGADERTDEGKQFLASRSPLNFIDQIKKPLMIVQGENDPRVKKVHSDIIVKAMREKNIPVTYISFPDEGHGFVREANKLAFSAASEEFLAKYLGGKLEPIGNDFDQSSIKFL